MRLDNKRFVLATVLGLIISMTTTVGAQDDKAAPKEKPAHTQSEADGERHEHSFMTTLQTLVADLKKAPHYQLVLENNWSHQVGDKRATGKHVLSLWSAKPGKLKLTVANGDLESPQLIVVSDGKTMTRWFAPDNIYSQAPATDPRQQVRAGHFTNNILDMCGADFLVTDDLVNTVESQLVDFSDHGIEEGRHHFHLKMSNGRNVDVWMSDAEHPLPLEIKRTQSIATGPDTKNTMESVSKFNWTFDQAPAEGLFTLPLAKDARRVADLQDAIAGRDADDLIGQTHPKLELLDLDDQPFGLQKGKPTLLYFWATWAAPSLTEMDGLKEYVSKIEQQGVAIHAVNVAEPKSQIEAFIKHSGFEGPVLQDSKGQSVGALRLTELPAVVLIGGDGKINAIFQKVNSATRDSIFEQIKKLSSK